MTLETFLDQFPDDEVALLLSMLRDQGHIVKDVRVAEGFAFETTIDGHRFEGRAADDRTAACALLLACGYDLE